MILLKNDPLHILTTNTYKCLSYEKTFVWVMRSYEKRDGRLQISRQVQLNESHWIACHTLEFWSCIPYTLSYMPQPQKYMPPPQKEHMYMTYLSNLKYGLTACPGDSSHCVWNSFTLPDLNLLPKARKAWWLPSLRATMIVGNYPCDSGSGLASMTLRQASLYVGSEGH